MQSKLQLDNKQIPTEQELENIFLKQFHESIMPFQSFMTDYQCAALEIETKFRVLNYRLSIQGDLNPIETIKSRIKQPESIIRKLKQRKKPLTLESIQNNLSDVAGVRIICSFIYDIYKLEECFLEQEDIRLIRRKDYIQKPKQSGYRGLHLVVKTPIYTETGRRDILVEVQMRTMAMDFWASLEHKLRYKKDLAPDTLKKLAGELEACAEASSLLDMRMQKIRDAIDEEKNSF